MARPAIIFGCVLFMFLIGVTSGQQAIKSITVDLRGAVCDNSVDHVVGDFDMLHVQHQPQFNTRSVGDTCQVTFRAEPGRRLEYSIDTLRFFECGVEISIYHDPNGFRNPRHILQCSGNGKLPIRDKSAFNVLRLGIRKINSEVRNYDFKMRIINDKDVSTADSPTGKSFDKLDDDYQGEALDPGIIAGIGIAGAIIIIALILLAIYLCVRARQNQDKSDGASTRGGESSVYISGNSQVLFPTKERYPRGRYGSMEDIHSAASKEKTPGATNGSYANPAYSPGPREKESQRSTSFGRASGGRAGFENSGFDSDDVGSRTTYDSWQEDEVRIGSFRRPGDLERGSLRRSRRDEFQLGEKKKLKSALKKPTDIEMSKVNTQPINGILKTRTARSPNRSQTSSTEGSYDVNALVHGYSHSSSKTEHPNIKHKPVIERRRSRSGTRSNRSTSSAGSRGRRAHSADRKQKPKESGRMYSQDVFIAEDKPRSSGRRRARSSSVGRRRDRGSDSVDSESSATSSRRVNMNPGGKRVHIKGEETDI